MLKGWKWRWTAIILGPIISHFNVNQTNTHIEFFKANTWQRVTEARLGDDFRDSGQARHGDGREGTVPAQRRSSGCFSWSSGRPVRERTGSTVRTRFRTPVSVRKAARAPFFGRCCWIRAAKLRAAMKSQMIETVWVHHLMSILMLHEL